MIPNVHLKLFSMFGMLLEKIILPDVQKVTGNVNKKVTAVGIIKILTDSPKLVDGPYSQFWYDFIFIYKTSLVKTLSLSLTIFKVGNN